jgi:NitT/TauT family transport system substrate-binding protein
MSSGLWLDASQANRFLAADIAAGPNFFNQKPEVLKFVLSNPPDRVTYGDLRVVRTEFEELVQLSLEAGIISRPISYEKYVDESFMQNVESVQITLEK